LQTTWALERRCRRCSRLRNCARAASRLRILIVCPAGLREQWSEECVTRFEMPMAIMDQQGVRRARTLMPVGVNPWTAESLVITSIDYMKRAEILPSVLEANWDVVIVDEAHGACGQSDRRDAVSSVCRSAPYVLLLSATPHNGDEAAFSTLCGLGRHGDELIVFRRSRDEAGRDGGRRAHTVRVACTPAERRMHAALAALTRAIARESADMDRSIWLMLSLLHKRALSSPFALAASAERRLQMLTDGGSAGVEQLLLPLDDGAGELDAEDAAPMWSVPALRDGSRERRLLEDVVAAARQAEGSEGKLRRLHRLIRAIQEPIIIFTEYRDTLLHVRNQVAPGAAVIHGGLTREQRRAALAAFPSAGVLLATDAAGEGLNLHEHCRTVINLELPWNPMRLEQRIGRVDRIGQRRRVHAFHLVAAGTGEARLLDRLSVRVSRAGARVGAPNPLNRPARVDGRRGRTAHRSSAGREPSDARRRLESAAGSAHAAPSRGRNGVGARRVDAFDCRHGRHVSAGRRDSERRAVRRAHAASADAGGGTRPIPGGVQVHARRWRRPHGRDTNCRGAVRFDSDDGRGVRRAGRSPGRSRARTHLHMAPGVGRRAHGHDAAANRADEGHRCIDEGIDCPASARPVRSTHRTRLAAPGRIVGGCAYGGSSSVPFEPSSEPRFTSPAQSRFCCSVPDVKVMRE
jgi:superfamily II DNA or RNA helicase